LIWFSSNRIIIPCSLKAFKISLRSRGSRNLLGLPSFFLYYCTYVLLNMIFYVVCKFLLYLAWFKRLTSWRIFNIYYCVNECKTFFSIRLRYKLEKIVREELNRHIASINLHKIIDIQQEDKEDIVIANTNLFDDQHSCSTPISLENQFKK
jgi:hypothetical protein